MLAILRAVSLAYSKVLHTIGVFGNSPDGPMLVGREKCPIMPNTSRPVRDQRLQGALVNQVKRLEAYYPFETVLQSESIQDFHNMDFDNYEFLVKKPTGTELENVLTTFRTGKLGKRLLKRGFGFKFS
ncbi:HTH domain protein [Striga asiatica]|uniref:HTH domain protein n=1 Tax=Striga asiatica TaxID=4170 RepID=A0A5A7QQ94_STRAF|nr:HTH domain protein [Striga asiatica]